jgi:hypothetical protein
MLLIFFNFSISMYTSMGKEDFYLEVERSWVSYFYRVVIVSKKIWIMLIIIIIRLMVIDVL